MFVKATAVGYLGGDLRHPGDVFEVADDIGPASWFEPVKAEAPSTVRRKATKEELEAIAAEKRASVEAAMAPPPMSDYDPLGTDVKG